MSALAANRPFTTRIATRPRRSLISASCVFAATGLFDLIARPYLGDHHSHAATTYAFTALLIPFALSMLWALAELRWSTSEDSRLGRVGFRMAAIGLSLFIPCAIDSLATTDPQALGPLYMIAMLASLVGTGLLSMALARAGEVARWAAIALPVAWLVGGPVGEGAIFRGAALILAAVSVAIAVSAPTASRFD